MYSWLTSPYILINVGPRSVPPPSPPPRASNSGPFRVKYGVRSPNFIWAPVYSCAHWLRPRNSPPPLPLHLGLCTRALLVSKVRRHLFVIPCSGPTDTSWEVGGVTTKVQYISRQHSWPSPILATPHPKLGISQCIPETQAKGSYRLMKTRWWPGMQMRGPLMSWHSLSGPTWAMEIHPSSIPSK